jgi:integrase
MAPSIRNPKLDSRTSRSKLDPRREPYWAIIAKGCALGYRRSEQGGTWIARFRDEDGKQHYESLGAADDIRDADAISVFNFMQAQVKARAFYDRAAREALGLLQPIDGPYTVAMALEDYFRARERRGSKAVASDRHVAKSRILPHLGTIDVRRLTPRQISNWQNMIATAGKLARGRVGDQTKSVTAVDVRDPDAVRARRATANRILTVLKAALNHAYQEGQIQSDEAWRRVKPYREVDSAVIRFLTADESRRLVNACAGEFRDLVRGALLTGCRYGELARMRVADFHRESGAVTIRTSKSGKPRHVALNNEGQRLFEALTAGRPTGQLVFPRANGTAWGPSQQQRPLEEASKHASLNPPATFHVLRHTYASLLAMKGVPMGVIAAQLGHADTRMTEKHYAHLAPSYVADTVRAAMQDLGIVAKSSLVELTK